MPTTGIALFGGTFNPVHIGHLLVARAVAEYLDLARVILIPAGQPPHRWGGELAPAAHRLEMVRLAVAGEPHLDVSDLELRQGGMTYSIRSAEAIREEVDPHAVLYWIIGGDALLDLRTWVRVGELVDLCRIVTAVRPGFQLPDLLPLQEVLSTEQIARLHDYIIPTPQIDASSTEIRWRIREGRSIRYLVPDAVMAYIAQHGLYRAPGPVRS